MPPKIPDSSFQGVSPVLLSSACDLLASNTALPDSGDLTYPFRKAVIIEEIRWDIRCVVGAFGGAINLGALVSTKMQVGRHVLMRDAMPIWLLGTFLSQVQEDGNNDPALAAPAAYSHYRWRLPKPLYIAAGEVLRSEFSRGADGLGSASVRVSYVGRTVPPNQAVPSVIAVPYAAPFVTTLGNAYQQSNENHLFNPFDAPVRVQRLTGRVLQFDAGALATSIPALTPATAAAGVSILMNDSWGGKMVNNNTGPSDAFDSGRCAWTVDTAMPGKGIYEVQVWNIPANYQIHVGMIATRDEAL